MAEAVVAASEQPTIKRRSGGVYSRLLMKLLSVVAPAPTTHVMYNPVEARPHRKPADYLWAIPMIVVILVLVNIQVMVAPWTSYSVYSGWMAVGHSFGIPEFVCIGIFVGAVVFILQRPFQRRPRVSAVEGSVHYQSKTGFLERAALFEEQMFRENSHRWNFAQRVASCVVFGMIHMVNLIYPLATILPIALMGGMFMLLYLRTYRRYRRAGEEAARRMATLRAAAFHRVYNVVALVIAIVWIAYMLFGVTLHLL